MKCNKKVNLFLIALLVLCAITSGCATRRVPNPSPNGDNITPNGDNTNPDMNLPNRDNENNLDRDNLPNSDFSPGDRNDASNSKTDDILRAVENIPQVKGASAVVTNDSAYIGINIDGNGNANNTDNVENVKKKVAELVRKTDKNIKDVHVSADPDFFQRIDNIGKDIRNGKPIEGFGEELRNLVDRITPQKK